MYFNMEQNLKVYCLIPTHNRIESLKNILSLLSTQTYLNICIIVIDDGSTDGTYEHLSKLPHRNMVVLRGDGELWWGGAVALGMKKALSIAKNKDYILLLNDDSIFDQYFINNMIEDSSKHKLGTMVSPQYDINTKIFSYVGYRLDYYRQGITQVKNEPIDATVGRGLLIPIEVVKRVGIINARKFPHYMGDIEFTARIKDYCYDLVIAWSAPIYSDLAPSDVHIQRLGDWQKYFHRRSKSNVFDILKLFHRRGPLWTRLTALPRILSRLGLLVVRSVIK